MLGGTTVEKAILYEKYRLLYAREAVDDLLGHMGEVQVVADIGAGTGQLARLFADRCARVYAIEPDPAMREVASASLASLASIEILAGFAEQTTLAEDSVDLIVIGNAFHRLKPEACQELRRILKKPGWIALFTYAFTNQAFTETLFSKLATLKSMTSKMEQSWHRTPVQNLFGEGQLHTLRYRQSHTEDWTAFFGAACSGIEAPTCSDQDFVEFEALNRQVFDAFAVDGKIQIDYETQVSFGQPLCP
ncbi:MAG TPA: class I SAM-dependent methyltransferase [Anaerolineae bacterium]|nr:class I SAM-dependent methyltransferase [Anaerolineae bacterium]